MSDQSPTVGRDRTHRPRRTSQPSEELRAALGAVRTEVAKAVVGQDAAVSGLVIALLCRGHVLLEGVPGVAKTLLVRALSAALDLEHQARPVHARPHAGRRDGLAGLRRPHRRVLVPRRARSSPTCCWPTRSTGRRPRRRRRCSRRWRSARCRSTAPRARCPTRSSSSRRRTPSSTRAPTRCPRRSSTGSCSSWCCRCPSAHEEIEVLTRHAAGFDPRDLAGAGVRPVATPRDARARPRRGRPRAGRPRGPRLRRRRVPRHPAVAVPVARRLPAWRHRAARRRPARGRGCPVAAT